METLENKYEQLYHKKVELEMRRDADVANKQLSKSIKRHGSTVYNRDAFELEELPRRRKDATPLTYDEDIEAEFELLKQGQSS